MRSILASVDLRNGFEQELAYWDRELSLHGDYPEAIRKRSIPERMTEEFPHYLAGYFERLRADSPMPRILDVGSGPLSMLAYGHRAGMFDLTCVDPLADRFRALLEKHGLSTNAELVNGSGEELASIFQEGAFDMVWMHNALDHSQSPGVVVSQLARVTRTGGYVVIQGWCREGTAEGWIGLHQHDLYLGPAGELICQSKAKEPVDISGGLPLKVVLSEIDPTVRDWMRLIYQKTV